MCLGLKFGYLANPNKTWLIVKPEYLQVASEVFHDTGINITSEGRRHLGAAIGSKSFINNYIRERESHTMGQ